MYKWNWLAGVFCILLMGCGQESQAQQDTQASLSLLKKRCDEISNPDGDLYTALFGEVVLNGWTSLPGYDCFTPECRKQMPPPQRAFYAALKPLTGTSEPFYVFTPPLPAESADENRPYLEKGKRYGFCAREAVEAAKHYKGGAYKIDFVETIQAIK